MSTKGHILIIEDDNTILELVTEYLIDEGYAVTAALTGADAVALTPPTPPNLILLDYGIGDHEGQSLAAVRQQAAWNQAPIILVSGHVNLDKLAVAEGCAGFVAKPFEIEQLLTEVRRFLP